MYKMRKPRQIEVFPLGLVYPHALRVYFPLLENKTQNCNQAVTLVHHFKSLLWQDRTKDITHSPDTVIVYLNANFSPVVLSRLVVSDSW